LHFRVAVTLSTDSFDEARLRCYLRYRLMSHAPKLVVVIWARFQRREDQLPMEFDRQIHRAPVSVVAHPVPDGIDDPTLRVVVASVERAEVTGANFVDAHRLDALFRRFHRRARLPDRERSLRTPDRQFGRVESA
jgi:hypothetical protein